ncbi:MAG: hypothetical protein MJA83_10505, partial [Gammaproteobacteria bacterium]|nr:hypothetical protein [Gammaproteobacteria bacterium]
NSGSIVLASAGGEVNVAPTATLSAGNISSGIGGFIGISADAVVLAGDLNISAGGTVLIDPAILNINAAAATNFENLLASGGTVIVEASDTINVNATIDSSAQGSTATLHFSDENNDGSLTVNLNADILLGSNQTLTGEGSTVNVSNAGLIQNGVDVADTGATVNVAAGTFAEDVVIDKSLTLSGAGRNNTTIQGVGGGQTAAVLISADNVSLGGAGANQGFRIEGAGFRAVHLDEGRSGVIVQNNTIVASTNNIALDTQGSQSNNIIRDNEFSANGGTNRQLVYINGVASLGGARASNNVSIINNDFSGTAQLALGNEAANSTITGNTFSGANSYATIEFWANPADFSGNSFNTANTHHMRRSSNGNTGAVAYTSAAAVVADNNFVTSAYVGGQDTIYGAVQPAFDAAAAGDTVNIGAGTYVENLVIDKAITLSGAGRDVTTLTSTSGNTILINSAIGAGQTVNIDNLGFANTGSAQRGIYVASNAVLGNLNVTDTRYQDYIENGLGVIGSANTGSQLGNIVVDDAIFLNNGNIGGTGGRGDLLLFYYNNDATLSNINISNTHPALTADRNQDRARYGIQLRGVDNGSFNSGSQVIMGNISLDNVTISGNYGSSLLGVQGFDGVANLSMNDVTLGGTGSQAGFGGNMLVSNVAQTGDTTIDVGNTNFLGATTRDGNTNFDVFVSGAFLPTQVTVDATDVLFDGVAVADMTTTQILDASRRVFDAVDSTGSEGTVTLRDGNVYVAALGHPFEEAGAVQRAVDLAG